MPTFNGLDVLQQQNWKQIQGKSLALLCNQASVTKNLTHIVETLLPGHRSGAFKIQSVLGPQHGLHGHTQDNMVEWEGAHDERIGIPIHSLYGQNREPTDEMLQGVDLFLVDLQDVGARYYTFVWTMALCMRTCELRRIPMLVLDRPNPIGGIQTEGPLLDPSLASFVGLHPLITRHGMTIAEIARYFNTAFYPNATVDCIQVSGWSRSDYFDDLDLVWIPPSPNMPMVDTAVVYPGMCLLEGTNVSEGRGTTRPFETFGAPWLDGWKLSAELNGLDLPGVRFRPIQFQPTFQKHQDVLCNGCFVHVTERRAFEPVLTAIAILRWCSRLGGNNFQWKDPPYEYENEKMPIDILFGKPGLPALVRGDAPLNQIHQLLVSDVARFESQRKAALLYPTS